MFKRFVLQVKFTIKDNLHSRSKAKYSMHDHLSTKPLAIEIQ